MKVDKDGNPIYESMYEEAELILDSFLDGDSVEIKHVLEKHPTYWITHRFTTDTDGPCIVQVWRSR